MRIFLVVCMLLAMIVMGLGILLVATDRFPNRELELAWRKVVTGKSELEEEQPPPEPPEEEPTLEQVIRERANQAREINRRQQEVINLLELAQARQKELEDQRKALTKIQQEIQKGYEEKQDAVVKQGRQNLLAKLEAMSPKLAKQFLLDQAETDEAVSLELIKKLDPIQASKIFKEFKLPAEIERLNQLLTKIGEGEPERSDLQQAKAQLPATTPN